MRLPCMLLFLPLTLFSFWFTISANGGDSPKLLNHLFGDKEEMKLDPTKVPKCCAHLTAMAERWGIGDDVDREDAVAHASRADLNQLVEAIQALPDDQMYEWLAGPESYAARPTEEYLAFSCMTMAYDSARVKLKKNGNTEPQPGPYR